MATLNTNLALTPVKIFQRGEVLGEGTFGLVLASEDPETHSPVALKIAKLSYVRELLLESKMLQQAQHPHVVGFRGILFEGNSTLILDRVAPDTYRTYLKNGKTLSAYETITIAKQLLEALASLHAKGLIHRDLKPNNVSYDSKSHQLKLFDFGLATKQDRLESGFMPQNRWYRAPEVFKGEPYDDRMDIWGVGCILFELYTGHTLFNFNSPIEKKEEYSEKYRTMCLEQINELTSSSPGILPIWQHWIQEAARRKGLTRTKAEQEAEQMISLIAPMLVIDPHGRIRALEALALPSLKADIQFTIETNRTAPFYFHLFNDFEETPLIPSELSSQDACPTVPNDLGFSNVPSVSVTPSDSSIPQIQETAIFQPADEESANPVPSTEPIPASPSFHRVPLLSIDLSRRKNVEKPCLHLQATATNRFVAEIVDINNQVVNTFSVVLKNGKVINFEI